MKIKKKGGFAFSLKGVKHPPQKKNWFLFFFKLVFENLNLRFWGKKKNPPEKLFIFGLKNALFQKALSSVNFF